MKQKEDQSTLDLYREDVMEAPSANALATIGALATHQLRLEAEIAATQTKLARLQRELRMIQETDLPDAMLAVNCTSYTLGNGARITIQDGISASLADPQRRSAACAWLEQNGFGDIVTHELSLAFGRGQEHEAEQAAAALRRLHLEPHVSTNVNTGTLKALIREQMQHGREIPLETLGAYKWRKAIIKPANGE